MRLLITGSRSWVDVQLIDYVLAAFSQADGVTLVSGACPDGADRICEHLAGVLGWTIERHPADWATHGRRAGFLRNRHMVELGADVCLAFISACTSPRCTQAGGRHLSHGATHTAALAHSAGIPTYRFHAKIPDPLPGSAAVTP